MSDPTESASQFCPQCGKEADADARFCKYCAYDLTAPPVNVDEAPAIYGEPPPSKTNLLIILAGLGVLVVIILLLSFFYLKSKGNSEAGNSNIAAAAMTLGSKGKQIEQKILRGEALIQSDIEGLSTEELRILRNVHFARYGRKYERPGLGDYFYNQPWYKPSDSYNDNMVTATDKTNINLILSVEKNSNTVGVTAVPSQTPTASPTPEISSSGGSLSNSNVQSAVNAFMREFTKGGSIVVQGIRELPNENAATADLKFAGWVCSTTYEGGLSKETPPPVTKDRFGMPSSTFGLRLVTYNTSGMAVLKHYNDGRWVLTQVRVGEGLNAVTLNGSMDVR